VNARTATCDEEALQQHLRSQPGRSSNNKHCVFWLATFRCVCGRVRRRLTVITSLKKLYEHYADVLLNTQCEEVPMK
jgi:hypothetical protein